ncbi:MAG: hypothetical protein HQL82_17120 [Magnetococcales bacterium]|nr:hypothetical protein [Magnetococcales bacterium]
MSAAHHAGLATKADLKLEVAEAQADLIRWMFGVSAGQTMVIIAILKLFPSH